MDGIPVFDEIHVISDIHMGGHEGFQIFRETGRLAKFIGWVAQRPADRVALVLNGDVIDTLAEDIHGYVAVDDAVATVSRIMQDPSFAPVWEALSNFIRSNNRSLIIVIGNHDIELAFPTVQRLILDHLSGDDAAARARVEFSTQGAGFACMVGNARVFCTHGNEVDPWNFNRYEDLSRVARRLNTGRTLARDEWTPNAGTRLVKEVMNEVKRKYAWIDLLKPETAAAIGTLLVLDPSQLGKIKKLLPIIGTKVADSVEVDQRLSADSLRQPSTLNRAPPPLESLLGPSVLESMQATGRWPGHSGDDMLLALEQSPDIGAAKALGDAPLGVPQLIWDRLTGWLTDVPPHEALRRALKDWLGGDKTFRVDDKDDTFQEVTSRLGPNIDFTVTGHTHLARAIDMGAGRYYFNCGTWVRLIQLTDTMLADAKSFKPVYDVLNTEYGGLRAIDDAKFNEKPLVQDYATSVSISRENGGVVGRLNQIMSNGTPDPAKEIRFERTQA